MTGSSNVAALRTGEKLLEWLAGRRAVVVSPHPDDAALSVGGLLCRLRHSWDLTLLTLFGRSGWVRSHWSGSRSTDDISDVRAGEEQAFAARLGAEHRLLTFDDAILRGYDAETELGQSQDDEAWQDRFIVEASAALDQLRPEVVVGPAAIGGHIDHVLTRHAVESWVAGSTVELLLYEDLPYAVAPGNHDRVRSGALIEVEVSLDDQLPCKLEHLGIYRSQLGERTRRQIESAALSARAVATPANGVAREILWMNRELVACNV